MDIRRLRIFLTVCDCENMTLAAKSLFMTQPSVSQAIAELEKEYGLKLFERLNHHLYLTNAGDRLRSYARHILNLADQAQKELSQLGHFGSIRIGASLTIGTHLLPHLVTKYREMAPDGEIFTRVDNTSVIEKLILEDQLDLGLVEGPVYSHHILEKPLWNDTLVFICSPSHRLALLKEVQTKDLNGAAFITREPGSGTRDVFENVMRQAGVEWTNCGIYNNIEAIKQAVKANLGLAVVSRISIQDEVNRGLIKELPIQGLTLKRLFNLVHHRQKFFTPAMTTFVDLCTSLK